MGNLTVRRRESLRSTLLGRRSGPSPSTAGPSTPTTAPNRALATSISRVRSSLRIVLYGSSWRPRGACRSEWRTRFTEVAMDRVRALAIVVGSLSVLLSAAPARASTLPNGAQRSTTDVGWWEQWMVRGRIKFLYAPRDFIAGGKAWVKVTDLPGPGRDAVEPCDLDIPPTREEYLRKFFP
jgi:hypothetical protein